MVYTGAKIAIEVTLASNFKFKFSIMTNELPKPKMYPCRLKLSLRYHHAFTLWLRSASPFFFFLLLSTAILFLTS